MLVAVGSISRRELDKMAREAHYRSSDYHKSGPTALPRRDKTVCDLPTSHNAINATDLLRSGFRRGMVSEQKHGGWPQNVWAVDADGIVYEAQLTNSGLGEYHGYPMTKTDSFAAFVSKEWENRGT